MKKLLIGAVSAVALSFALGAAPASAAGFNASKYCTANGDFSFFFNSHGDCVSYFESQKPSATAFCKYVKETYPSGFDSIWKNLGDCISDFAKYNNN